MITPRPGGRYIYDRKADTHTRIDEAGPAKPAKPVKVATTVKPAKPVAQDEPSSTTKSK